MTATDNLKRYLKNELLTKRAELGLTQEQMAEMLNVSLRSYSNLEHGKFCCSLSSFVYYVINCDVDKDKLFLEMAERLNKSDE